MLAPTGVCLLYMGGPADLDGVRPFLEALFADRDLIRLPGGPWLQGSLARLIVARRAPRVQRYYTEIGGGSPLLAHTRAQAAALEAALAPAGDFRIAIAMRYAPPRAEEALAALRDQGVQRCVALPLYPQYSSATTGSSYRDLDRAVAALGLRWELCRIADFHDHPLYLDALAAQVAAGLEELPGACVVFAAHSLPRRLVDRGDPYASQVQATVAGVVSRLQLRRWHLGFQSRSGPVRWLEPELTRLVDELIAGGEQELLLVPVSFVSDHIETLHEIDIRLRRHCLGRGLRAFARAPSLNDDPRFIAALSRIVLEALPRPPSANVATTTAAAPPGSSPGDEAGGDHD